MTNMFNASKLTNSRIRLISLALQIGLFVVFKSSVASIESCQLSVGKFVSIEGTIQLERANQQNLAPANLDTQLCQNDTVHVGENSRAAIALINDVVLRLDQNTTMQLTDIVPEPEKQSLLNLVAGAFKSFSRPPRFLKVNTPYVNGLIEGTEFAMQIKGSSTNVTVYEGKVLTSNEKGKLSLTKGQSATANAGQAPQPFVLVKPLDAVQWTLHFPPLLAISEVNKQSNLATPIQIALELAERGQIPDALASLKAVPVGQQDANFYLYRAAILLNLGHSEDAQTDISAALAQDQNAGLAYALLSVIQIANNDNQQALSNAEKGVSLSPTAATKIALSYAQQAVFNLGAARATMLSAAKNHPENSLVWARLGELWLMAGERDKALDAANKAQQLAPNQSRNQDVFGFAALAENEPADAKSSFERAIALNSADPLAHFGRGLAIIKNGNLKEGRKEIEAAVALDSSNALLRSYLGKSYYEEKRYPLDDHQYGITKELDPADPTPYLYSAISKQTTNRPVEALQDVQKAIELNDNRAVYRSRQLLDSDLAARSASMGRIYSDLGFQQLALREGWKSVNNDQASFSAHRLLADSYAAQPRHEIARVSELLQSQLLQPLSMTPIQPRLAESNLFLISAGGPGSLSYNEFSPIFNRDGLTFQTSGLIGERNTYSGEGVLSGIFGKAAFSFGGFHSTSDGFRKNDDFKDDIANAFVQYEISPRTSIQAEYRYRSTETGDLQRRFFSDNFLQGLRNSEERHTYRLGVKHDLSVTSTLLGSFIYQDAKFLSDDTSLQQSIEQLIIDSFGQRGNAQGSHFLVTRPEQSVGFELQHLFRSEYVNITSGIGHSDITGKLAQNAIIKVAPPFDFISSTNRIPSISTNLQHTNAYAYSYVSPLKNLKLTLGVSGDFTDGDSLDVAGINKINPKFGISWEPVPGTWLRAAAFHSLKRTLITNQTLEPTQVAGFNQFFDDPNGTRAWRYGVGIDQKFSKSIFAGIEVSRRDLDVPQIGTVNDKSFLVINNVQESLARSYLFLTPLPWLSLRAEYQFEHLKTNAVDPLAKHMDSHRVPLGFNVFLPSGLSGSFTATYNHQDGIFQRQLNTQNYQSASSDFWLLDAGLSYRLPKRYGFVTVGATNLLNRHFNYLDTDINNPRVQSGRMVFGKVTLALP